MGDEPLGRWLRSGGDPEEGGADRLGGAFFVEDIDLGDREAGVGQEIGDRAGEVAPAEEALLHRLEAELPAPEPTAWLAGARVSFVTFHVSRPSQKVVSRAHYDRGGGAVEHVAYVTERCDLRSEA